MKKSINLMMGSAMVASSVALMSCTPTNAVNSAINNAANKVNQAAQVSNAVSNAKIETVTLALSGLTWAAGCPPKVQSALSKVDGVVSATASMTSAVVVVNRSKVTDAQLIAAVRGAGAGFGATVK